MKRVLDYLLKVLVNADDHIFIVKQDFTILVINDRMKNFLGCEPEEILGLPLSAILTKDAKERLQKCADSRAKSQDRYECNLKLYLKNSTPVEVTMEFIPFDMDSESFLLVKLKKDISKEKIYRSLKQNNEPNLHSEKYFELIVKQLQVGIWELDLENNKIYWNDELYKILSKSGGKPMILPTSDNVLKSDRTKVRNVFHKALEDGKNYHITYRVVDSNGKIRYIDEHAIHLKDNGKDLLLGFDVDVTQREESKEKLAIQKKNIEQKCKEIEEATQKKNRFISSLSHEIKTLLNAILGYAQILKNDSRLDAHQKKRVEAILLAGGYLLDLMNDMLQLSKLELGEKRVNKVEFNLTNMLKSLYQIFKIRAENKKINWYIQGLPQEDFVVYTDKTKLFHALLNLIGNAIKFTEKGEVKLIFRYKDGRCYFEVADTGIGIDKELKKHIFEPFIQNSVGYERGGSGLGLAIAKSNVELLEGELQVESQLGRGSRFFFEIPCQEIKKTIVSKSTKTPSFALRASQTIDVLIVDDQRENREILKEILKQKNISVAEAKSGKEAIELYKKRPFDIVFMDVYMPETSGNNAAKLIKQIDPEAKIVAVSSMDEEEVHMEYFSAHLQKPIVIEEIDHILCKLRPDIFTSCMLDPRLVLDRLSEEVANQISTMAQIGDVSGLKRMIDEIGDQEVRMILTGYLKNFDFDKIEQLLKRVSDEQPTFNDK